MLIWLGLVVLATLLFILVWHENIYAAPMDSQLQPKHAEAVRLSAVEIKVDAWVIKNPQLSTQWNCSNRSDEAWAEAVAAYECAMQHLAAGKPGSRIEAQTSALELARLQGLLMQASQPHFPLGL